ncbi:MAG: hypothetical protein WBE22_10425 [Halobacteriota archaeon]
MAQLIKQSVYIPKGTGFISATNFLPIAGENMSRGLTISSPSMNQNRNDQKSIYENKNFAMTSLPAMTKSRNRISSNAGDSAMYLSLDFLKETKIALKTRSPMPRYTFCDKRSPRNIDEKRSMKRSEVMVDEQEKKKM